LIGCQGSETLRYAYTFLFSSYFLCIAKEITVENNLFLLFFFACPKKNETRLPVKLPKVVRQERTLLQDALFALTSPMLHKFLLKYCNKKLENSFSFFLSLLQKETKKTSQNDASTLPYEFCNFLIKGSTRL
jgi:hypothetical protein